MGQWPSGYQLTQHLSISDYLDGPEKLSLTSQRRCHLMTDHPFQQSALGNAGYEVSRTSVPLAQALARTSEFESQSPGHVGDECECVACWSTQRRIDVTLMASIPDKRYDVSCRMPDCEKLLYSWGSGPMSEWKIESSVRQLAKHENTHFGSPGNYHCLEPGCRTTTKKFEDLKRHYRGKHCTKPTYFPCPILDCKYSGANGFPRKDKLKSHYRNVHEKKAVSGKPKGRCPQANEIEAGEHT